MNKGTVDILVLILLFTASYRGLQVTKLLLLLLLLLFLFVFFVVVVAASVAIAAAFPIVFSEICQTYVVLTQFFSELLRMSSIL